MNIDAFFGLYESIYYDTMQFFLILHIQCQKFCLFLSGTNRVQKGTKISMKKIILYLGLITSFIVVIIQAGLTLLTQ